MGARGKVKRKDAPHKEIVKALEKIGASVLDLSGVGGGCPDLLVWYRGKMVLMEVKRQGGKLRASQKEFVERWPGTVCLAETPEGAIELVTRV